VSTQIKEGLIKSIRIVLIFQEVSENSRTVCAFKSVASKALNIIVNFMGNQGDSSQY